MSDHKLDATGMSALYKGYRISSVLATVLNGHAFKTVKEQVALDLPTLISTKSVCEAIWTKGNLGKVDINNTVGQRK
jgi:hypothetical protein